MRDEYTTWQVSAHKNIPCARCHQYPGFLGQGIQRLRLLSMVSAKITGFYREPISVRVPDSICLSCHVKEAKQTVTVKGIRINHRDIIKSGWTCGACHNSVVHGDAVPIKSIGSMDKCLPCHNEKLGYTECEFCHRETPKRRGRGPATPWRIAHGPNWRRTHAALDIRLCQTCHTELYCSRCHKLSDVPHSENWLAIHGPKAAADKGKCYQCHKKELCAGCHVLPMPHPADWLPKHFGVVKARGEKLCLNCHMRRSCGECHEKHVHPLTIEKWNNIRKRGGKSSWPGL